MDAGDDPGRLAPVLPAPATALTEPVAPQDGGLVSLETQEQAAQVEVVVKAGAEVKSNTTELRALVKAHRFHRLDRHAAKYHWSLEEPPLQAATNPEVLDWWNEWRGLRVAQEAQMARMAAKAPQESAAPAPASMAAPQ